MTKLRARMATKISLALMVMVGASLLISGGYSYYSLRAEVERNLGLRLLGIAQTASQFVSVDSHMALVEGYLENRKGLATSDHFRTLQKQLRSIAEANGLKTDVYTVIDAQWAETRSVVFIGTSSDEAYIGRGLEMSVMLQKVFDQRKAQVSTLYEDDEGAWLSAAAPLIDRKGRVVGAIEVDFRAAGEVLRADQQLLYNIVIPGGLALLLAGIIGLWLGHHMSTPLTNLAEIASKLAMGNFTVRAKRDRTQEIDSLAHSFNEMVEQLDESRARIEDYSRTLEEKVKHRTEELREKDKVVYQSSKLAAIGELAAGVAHEINNPLQIIGGLIELAKVEGEPERRDALFKKVNRSVKRIGKIVNGLRIYAHQSSTSEKTEFSIHENLTSSMELLEFVFRSEAIEISLDFQAEADIALGEAGEFQQIILNLVTNARDAMPDGGTLTVSTRTKDGQIEISIADTGTGIAESDLDRIFEQFYTTKDVGKGTGLGLSIVYGLIKNMKGDIRVDSRPGKGTTFCISLPVEARPLAPSLSEKSSADIRLEQNVLLVDDEPEIVETLAAQLRQQGANVLTASSAGEAMETMKTVNVDLLLTDCRMPEQTGIELIQSVKQLYPQVHVVLITGEIGPGQGASELDFPVLLKPFHTKDLFDLLLQENIAQRAGHNVRVHNVRVRCS